MAEEPKINETLLKFDVYDVLGYLVPGATVVYGIFVYGKLLHVMDMRQLRDYVPGMLWSLEDWPRLVALTFLGTFVVYVIGHITALLSSSLFDKLVVERTLGYPFERLFRRVYDEKKLDSLWYARRSKLFYKAILLVLVTLLTAYFAEWHFVVIRLLICVFAVLILLKLRFTWLCLEDWRDPTSLRSKDTQERVRAAKLWDTCNIWLGLRFLYGIHDAIVLAVLSLLFRMQKPFPRAFQEAFKERFEALFRTTLEDAGTNIYWLCYIYLCQNDKESTRIVQHWLNLYAFARNLCTAFLVLCFYGLIAAKVTTVDSRGNVAWVCTTGTVAFLLFFRYYYIYYNYYSKYIFRAFLAHRLEN